MCVYCPCRHCARAGKIFPNSPVIFLTRIAAEEGKRVRSIRTEAQALLAANHWPSNVHQLENAIFRAVVLADSDVIGAGEFRQVAAQVSSKATSIQPAVEPSPALAVSWPEPDTTTGTETPEIMAERHSVPLTDPRGNVRPPRGYRARCHPFRHVALSRADVRGCAQA